MNSFWNIILRQFYNSSKNSCNKYSSKKIWGKYLQTSSKTDPTTIVNIRSLIILSKGKISYEWNLILIKFFLHSPSLPPFIVLIKFVTLFRMGFFGAALKCWGRGGRARSNKDINHVTHPLSSADISIFYWKSTSFPISTNPDIDSM